MNYQSNESLLTGSWTEVLTDFVGATTHELLILSPWITIGVARLISESLAGRKQIKMNIIARLDEEDFLSGTSHLDVFRSTTYPPNTHVEIKALKLLHAKMLVSDRERAIVGSANLTDGGLYRNHEAGVLVSSATFAEQCAAFFFRLWEQATPVGEEYFAWIETQINSHLPKPDEDDAPRRYRTRLTVKRRNPAPVIVRYVQPQGFKSARKKLSEVLQRAVEPFRLPAEPKDMALKWLRKDIGSLPITELEQPDILYRLERLFYHDDIDVRATAIDRAGRCGVRKFIPRLQSLLTNPHENGRIRSASAFALSLLGAPESFNVLHLVSDEISDAGRWAKRGCFLLLGLVGVDERRSFLESIDISDPNNIIELVSEILPEQGTISERLTKALILEKLATDEWNSRDLDALSFIMYRLIEQVTNQKQMRQFSRYDAVIRFASEAFQVRQGDLRHGPLSVSLLRRIHRSGWGDAGLAWIFSDRWARILENSVKAAKDVSQIRDINDVVELLDQ